jgi:proline iminopeptidase
MPVLIVDGSQDIRPRWAVDSLHRALPHAQRVNLAGAGHLPWIEDPQGFQQAVATFLARTSHTVRGRAQPPAASNSPDAR